MANKPYRVIAGSAAARFHASKAKIKLYGGGFANGKTTALVAEALKLSRDYPGSTGMLGRATYANLQKTLAREFFKWCPPGWIKSANKNDGVVQLQNGTTIDMRYIAQQQSSEGESSSNLLSANYDWIIVDQIEDPEITHHDFMQLMGRLRGNTDYVGDDPDMPRTGPRQMILSANPSLGWLYKELVKPLHDFRAGRDNDRLICLRDGDGKTILDAAGKKQPLVDVFEASTYDNAQNLGADYLQGLEATYTGKMRDRYILGKWVAFEGTVYDEFDSNIHVVADEFLREHVQQLRALYRYNMGVAEGYDFGIAEPSCFLHAQTDAEGNIYLLDGFYEKEMGIAEQASLIKGIRTEHDIYASVDDARFIRADPAIFRRTNASTSGAGPSTASLFQDEGIIMQRGNNNILNGILKVKAYLRVEKSRINPFTHAYGAPKLYVSDKLSWMIDEFETYRWKRNRDDSSADSPVDAKNHAMDALKYLLSEAPAPAIIAKRRNVLHPVVHSWTEHDAQSRNARSHRYGS
jgi:hypothetical protein